MELVLEFWSLVGIGILFGFVSANVSKWLIEAMGYKGIFESLLSRKATKAAIKVNHQEWLLNELDTVEHEKDYDGAAEKLSSIYWELVRINPSFKLWLCVTCMSTRVNLILSVVLFLITSLMYDFRIEMIAFAAFLSLISFASNYKFL